MDIMDKEIDRMNNLVNRTLSIFREKRLEKIKIPVQVFFKEIGLIASVMGKVKPEITIDVNVEHQSVFIAPDLMKEALLNLIGNALEASEGPAKVNINVFEKGRQFCISIRDFGMGIEESIKKQIFTPFYTTKQGGTGLGLAVTKRIIELHDGTIQCECQKEIGCTFTIKLPLGELEP